MRITIKTAQILPGERKRIGRYELQNHGSTAVFITVTDELELAAAEQAARPKGKKPKKR